MIQRYITMTPIPEIRPDPIQHEKVGTEMEVVIPLEYYDELLNLIRQIRYAKNMGMSTYMHWKKFAKFIFPYLVSEKDRNWFKKHLRF